LNGPQQILALTFSNKAKANLRTRLEMSLGPNYWHDVAVLNFHGLGLRLFRHHAPLAGRRSEDIAGPQRGSLRALRRHICDEHHISAGDLDNALRLAKSGAYTDSEVLERLQESPAALAYELALRKDGRIDYDDAIRLGLLIARHPSIDALYRSRFACVLVDEVQDLSVAQFELVSGLGNGRTVFAGDRAQGIYGFAGAAPAEVYAAIEARAEVTVTLAASYRSAPNIVSVVSAISVGLGGTQVITAADAGWSVRGEVVIEHFSDPDAEATRVIELVRGWLTAEPSDSVGVMVRAKHRRATLDEAVRNAGLVSEIWDFPAHRPAVVALLTRFVGVAVRAAGEGTDGVEELFLRCAEALSDDDEAMLDELSEAADVLLDLVEDTSLTQVVAGIRIASDPDAPARAGLHLLNGHVGKGQQFDRVVVLGMEDGHIPYYRARTDEDLKDELAVLHVMASRARKSLLFTVCHDVPHNGSPWVRKPSRWLKPLEKYATGWVDSADGYRPANP
jgi:DNA helicase-2/ATP-dependent DNA helicase PcrA